MRRSLLAVLLILAALFASAWLVLRPSQPDSVAKRVDRSVVRIFVTGPQNFVSGTGFVVSEGIVITNYHVVRAHQERSWNIVVADRVGDKEYRRPAELVGVFPGEDLAVLRVDGLDRPSVSLAQPWGDAKGLEILAIGFPGAADRLGPKDETSVAYGTVSRTFTAPWGEGAPKIQIIQHTAPTNPGNSGGPLVDSCGHVVGVNSQREARVVFGPGGIPLVTETIQGVFYASGVEVLTGKLEEAKIPFRQAAGPCRSGVMGALQREPENILAIGAIMLSVAGLGLLFRQRALVQVVVYCGDTISGCIQAVERALRGIPSKQRTGMDISVIAGGVATEHKPGLLLSRENFVTPAGLARHHPYSPVDRRVDGTRSNRRVG